MLFNKVILLNEQFKYFNVGGKLSTFLILFNEQIKCSNFLHSLTQDGNSVKFLYEISNVVIDL